MASACVWKGKFVFSRREWRVSVDVVKVPGNLLRPGLSCQLLIQRGKLHPHTNEDCAPSSSVADKPSGGAHDVKENERR